LEGQKASEIHEDQRNKNLKKSQELKEVKTLMKIKNSNS
jgi:hypothetical protein